jgi:hypothetical protein
LILALSKGPNRVDVSVPSPEDGNRPSYSYLEFWMMEKVPQTPVILRIVFDCPYRTQRVVTVTKNKSLTVNFTFRQFNSSLHNIHNVLRQFGAIHIFTINPILRLYDCRCPWFDTGLAKTPDTHSKAVVASFIL